VYIRLHVSETFETNSRSNAIGKRYKLLFQPNILLDYNLPNIIFDYNSNVIFAINIVVHKIVAI